MPEPSKSDRDRGMVETGKWYTIAPQVLAYSSKTLTSGLGTQ